MKQLLAFIVVAVLLLFGLKTCVPIPKVPVKQPISLVAPQEQSTDTIIKTVIQERVVVKTVYVPRIVSGPSGKPKYLLKTDTLTIAAECNSAGISIDSIHIPNTKTITYTNFKKEIQVSVRNSSPYFKSANVEGFVIPTKEVPRFGVGPFIGVGVTPTGIPVPVVGIGVSFNVLPRR